MSHHGEIDSVESILRGVYGNDAHAWDRLVEKLQATLDRWAEKLIRLAPAIGESPDLVQDAWVKIHKNVHTFRGKTVGELRAWAIRILRNVRQDILKSRGAKKRDASRSVHGDAILPDLAADSTSPSQRAVRKEQLGLLLNALPRLPESDRRVIELRIRQDLSWAEVGERLGLKAGTACQQFARAILKLREMLGGAS
jgi:RNA polymerase sigma-70 factor (ECF subfamily)